MQSAQLFLDVLPGPGQACPRALRQLFGRPRHPLPTGDVVLGDDFRGGTGGGSAEIGDKIGNREINLVPHGRDHGQGRRGDGASHHLFVEAPEVFQGTTTPGQQEQVQWFMRGAPAVESINGRNDFRRGSLALDPTGGEDNLETGVPPADDVEDILQRGPGGRSDDANAVRVRGQGPLSFGSKESLGGQLLLESFEGGLKGAEAFGFDAGYPQLVRAAGFIDGEFPAQDNLSAVADGAAIGPGLAPKEHAIQLRAGVLEDEVKVSAGLLAEVGDLAANIDRGEFLFDQALDPGGQVGDGPNGAGFGSGKQFAATEIPL